MIHSGSCGLRQQVATNALMALVSLPLLGSVRLQVVVMIHSGSRGLGHQVATDALTAMERAMARDGIRVNDRQLACAHISSQARPGIAFLVCFPRWGPTTECG